MTHRTRRGALLAAAAIAIASLVAGCGRSGLYSYPLASVRDVSYGSSTSVGPMLVRNAFVLGPTPTGKIPAGGRATVYVWLVNHGRSADQLVGASVKRGARSVRISHGAINVLPNRIVEVGTGHNQLVLLGLTHSLTGGENFSLTLHFAKAGAVRLDVPVLPRSGPYATLTPAAHPSPRTLPTVAPSVTPSPAP